MMAIDDAIRYLRSSATKLGLELEVEFDSGVADESLLINIFHDNGDSTTQVVGDSSLRGGLEIVSPPLNPRDVPGWMRRVNAALIKYQEQAETKVVFSERCGLHVHVSNRYTAVQGSSSNRGRAGGNVLAFWMALALHDRVFFGLTDPKRGSSPFCTWSLYSSETEALVRQLWAGRAPSVGGNKYQSVNATRLDDIGTLELRHFRATTSSSAIRYILIHIAEATLLAESLAGVYRNHGYSPRALHPRLKETLSYFGEVHPDLSRDVKRLISIIL